MIKLLTTDNPERPYNVQYWTKTGSHYAYCGYGRFCRTWAEAMEAVRDFSSIHKRKNHGNLCRIRRGLTSQKGMIIWDK